MSELRRKALTVPGSGKTISRKALSRQSSPATSRTNSRATSRAASRVNTDDEAGNSSDEGSIFSSVAGDIEEVDPETGASNWEELLDTSISRMLENSSKSSYQIREEALQTYISLLSSRFVKSNIETSKTSIVNACLRSIKHGRTINESLLAAKAIGLTIVTDPTEEIFDQVKRFFKQTITDCENFELKIALIHQLSAAAYYGGATLAEREGIMDFFMEIIESDGSACDATDDAGVVTAALEEWGFLVTWLEDAEQITKDGMDALVEQLNSSEVSVQVAAGENIALLYEMSYTPAEDDEVEDRLELGTKWVERYQPYGRKNDLIDTLTQLSLGSKKHLSKKNKKTQKSAFSDIVLAIQNPLQGPKSSNAMDKEGKAYGSRIKVKMHKTGLLTIDKWWKLLRLQHLRRLLGGGFLNHWKENPVLFESLNLFAACR
ncbi:interferon-related developmental regulator-domain-containing protein [Pyronema domesticum]|uniref:Interferon-related developmental regulator N-terminal domain-containing protein n=1 Tax=Pyronema omphalodes (strain CBS 100304) TaxID=1076935 RepID=U4L457_PYROM|nr:interferon-related developmental regulator-domain-containing protein [Pyronema domesticum]CCX07068.1 Similar to hypothetical protein [Tuber melanosporum Mel28]; acc. no. XP_002836215 [Pyronema omphalodes CBS 100304]